ncbi:hypothetical protein WA1_07030 [Scytonema hofmannii PCC 7110]|uniref:Uncharacterized protein n=1 Tax=Scytonema hofmannii PCC 7110 TaxID=128403 RepID=A0A139WT22_9CYAN|nr:hypothetical protein [Scytonema hofmannii]KYC35570.1 hypothetical protein WA1_07030 [Scytonema hofmannii PCC 7110]
MAIVITLKPEIEAQLIAQAAVQGISVEEFLQMAIEGLLIPSQPSVAIARSPQERALAFVNWAKSHSIQAPPLSDEAISRESIYTREDEML